MIWQKPRVFRHGAAWYAVSAGGKLAWRGTWQDAIACVRDWYASRRADRRQVEYLFRAGAISKSAAKRLAHHLAYGSAEEQRAARAEMAIAACAGIRSAP